MNTPQVDRASRQPGRQRLVFVAFKVDQILADELNRQPNKSQFIREAILAQLKAICPVCQGDGTVAPGARDSCHRCPSETPAPTSVPE
jgi:hypothetical protein